MAVNVLHFCLSLKRHCSAHSMRRLRLTTLGQKALSLLQQSPSAGVNCIIRDWQHILSCLLA